jgi:Xaa-Pro aminopeptidase
VSTVRLVPELPAVDHLRRRHRIAARLTESDHDAVLVTDLVDLRWLTGFGGSNGWAVLRGDDLVLGTDGRYGDRARAETSIAQAEVIAEPQRHLLHERLLEVLAGARRVALDPSTIMHASWQQLATDIDLVAEPSWIVAARRVKDDSEIARIRAAAAAADAALAEVEPRVLAADVDTVTEADIRNDLEHRMRLHGADDRSYATIVASGPVNAARPHHEVGHRTLAGGDTVVIDVGSLVDGYHSDMTRSYVVGDPSELQTEVYELVERAQQAGLAAVRAGVRAGDVDGACRDVFREAGYGEWYLHGTGHGVGLQIHEDPFLSATSDDVLEEGTVVTVEPGLYRDGFGGFRIEDLVVVTATGHRVLTHTPKRHPKD